MDVLVLRLIHIVSGAFWVGAVFTFFFFIQPTANALGPDGQQFVLDLTRRRRFSVFVLGAGALTVAAGLTLLWIDSSGFDLDWMSVPPGMGFTVGGVAALTAFVVGSLIVFPQTRRIEAIAGRLAAEGRPPTGEELAAIDAARVVIRRGGWIVVAGLALAVAAMATARYWSLVLR